MSETIDLSEKIIKREYDCICGSHIIITTDSTNLMKNIKDMQQGTATLCQKLAVANNKIRSLQIELSHLKAKDSKLVFKDKE